MSIPVEEVRKASGDRLQVQLCAVFTSPTGGIEPILNNMKEPPAFQVSLEREGILYAAGPMWRDDEKTWNGDGLVIIRAKSRSGGAEIGKSDLMHVRGPRNFTARPWMINEGTVTIRLDNSSQTFSVL